jgi:hypothetical protein
MGSVVQAPRAPSPPHSVVSSLGGSASQVGPLEARSEGRSGRLSKEPLLVPPAGKASASGSAGPAHGAAEPNLVHYPPRFSGAGQRCAVRPVHG